MSDKYIGNFADNATVRIYLNTFDSTGAPVAPSSAFTASDFAIYKNGSATPKATTNGIAVTSPFNSLVGVHLIEIDMNNDTGDSGFWGVGNDFELFFDTAKTVDSISVDGRVLRKWACQNRVADAVGDAIDDIGSNADSTNTAVTNTGVAISAATIDDIQDGLATLTNQVAIAGYLDTEVAAIKAQTDKLTFDGVNNVAAVTRTLTQGALAQFVTDDTGETAANDGSVSKLSQGGSGGEGGTFNYTVQVSPGISAGTTNCDATDRTKYNLEARKSDSKTFAIPVYESDGITPYDFTGMTLRVVVESKLSATDRQVIESADITVSDNIVSFTTTTANTISGKSETLKWALQRITTSPAAKEDILFGDYYVREGCAKD